MKLRPNPPTLKDRASFLGEVEISQEATLSDLKLRVCALPQVSSDWLIHAVSTQAMRTWRDGPGNCSKLD